MLVPDRLFPVDPSTRGIARELYQTVVDKPIISPHGHTDPHWYAENKPFSDPSQLFIAPDHYVFRMLFSQGVSLESLGVQQIDGGPTETDGRKIWRLFAENYHLFRGTPSRLWLDHAFEDVFGLTSPISKATADQTYDHIADCLAKPEFRPRALCERFNIEVIATTECPLDDLRWHRMIRDSDWKGRMVTAYRPDAVVDPEFEGFAGNVEQLGALTDWGASTWEGYLQSHRIRRAEKRAPSRSFRSYRRGFQPPFH